MRKSLVSILIGLMMLGISANSWAGPPATDVVCTGCINDTDIATGAVTDAKITGQISASKLEKPANVVVVAKSGGDYTSISAALAAINPTADNPYVVKVMPGTYDEPNQIIMKSYVNLEGAGRDTTIILGRYNPIITLYDANNAEISGFTVKTLDVYQDVIGIHIVNSSFTTIKDNHFTSPGLWAITDSGSTNTTVIKGNVFTGMGNHYNPAITLNSDAASSPVITDNLFKGNYQGIVLYGGSGSPLISKNVFTENGKGISWGLYGCGDGAPPVKDNTIKSNSVGIELYCSAIVTHNRITDNSPYTDIRTTGGAHISYNVFDTLSGWGGPMTATR